MDLTEGVVAYDALGVEHLDLVGDCVSQVAWYDAQLDLLFVLVIGREEGQRVCLLGQCDNLWHLLEFGTLFLFVDFFSKLGSVNSFAFHWGSTGAALA